MRKANWLDFAERADTLKDATPRFGVQKEQQTHHLNRHRYLAYVTRFDASVERIVFHFNSLIHVYLDTDVC